MGTNCVVGGPLGGPGDEKCVLRFASAIAPEDPGPSTAGAKRTCFSDRFGVRALKKDFLENKSLRFTVPT